MRTSCRPELHAALTHCANRFLLRYLFFCLLALSFGWAAAAQTSTTGALHGTLSTGQVHSLRNLDTGETFSIQPRPDHTFLLPALPPGTYVLSGPGIAAASVIIALGETTEYPAQIAPFPDDLVDDEAPAASSPQTTQLAPDQDGDGLSSVHGLPSTQNTLLIDGLSATQAFSSVPVGAGTDAAPDPADDSDSAELTTGPTHGLSRGRRAGAAYGFSSAATRSAHLAPSVASALSGGAPTASSLLSRSGSPRFHGSAFFNFRSQEFAATNPLSLATRYLNGASSTVAVKPHDQRETYAFTFGGPLPRTPLFFFYTFDAQRRDFPAVSSPANPAFYTLSAVQQALLRTRGVSTQATQSALSYLDSLTGEVPRRADQTIHFARLDWHPHTQALGLAWNRLRWNHPAGLTEAPVVAAARSSIGSSVGSADALVLSWTSNFNSRRINQFRLEATRDLQFQTPQTPLPQEPAIGPGGLAPEVVIGPDGLRFGTPANLSRQAYPDERRVEAADSLSLVVGRHLIQAGAEFSALDDRIATQSNQAGTFRYDSTRTTANAGGLVDFITDQTFNVDTYPNGACPSISAPVHLFCFTSFTQSFGQTRIAFPTQNYAVYTQDTWRLLARLTLTAGLRYEYLLLPLPTHPNPALDLLFSSRAATSIFPEDRNNLGPHVSVSAEPFGAGRLTIQAGYSTFFGRLPGATIAAALSETALPATTLRVRITPSAVTVCPQAVPQGFGYPCSFTSMPTGAVATTTSATLFDRHFRLPVVQQATLRLSRTLGRYAELSAAYLLNLDRQLPSSTDINIAPSTSQASFLLQGGPSDGQSFQIPLYTSRVTSSFGPVTDVLSNTNATYNALLLTARTRVRSFFTAETRYTWSKTLDTGAALSGIPRTNSQFDPFDHGYDKALSSLNYPQSFRFLAVASTPRTSRHLLAGWELAPIVLVRSGRPYSYDLFGGTRLSGGHLSINGSGGALYLPTVGRNTLRLPLAIQTDLRLARTFHPSLHLGAEPVSLRISAEAFNLINRTNISSVEQRAYLTGTPTATVTPLIFQDASHIAAEGLTTQPFATQTAASTSLQRERQLQFSFRLSF